MTPSGERSTRQRAAIVAVMDQLPDFRSARQIHLVLRERGHDIGLATVYRSLHRMEERGEVDVLRSAGGETAVYRRCERKAHHHHLVCRSCGRAVEVEGPAIEHWARRMAEQSGFSEVTHTVEVFGTCGPCRR
ncbi:Fur family transcriptional regulator [Cellulomonas pakistanensis]|uniref:Transcriptional repressor n=1 Tax=Cellulomonas pakistanensis TaxID=992287 RepID=A0A919PC42_9CELL|nr:Fur family transcriptional regulator [Cellulomonas pakistanensis]GIG36946.1 transcriptional repressor [Cellulomonas pakistanensis]